MKSLQLPFTAFLCVLAMAYSAAAETKIPIPTPRPDRPPQAMNRQQLTQRTKLEGAQMTLADAVFLGLRNNRNIKSAYIDRVAQKFDLRVAEDRFSPQFSISGEIARQRIAEINSTTIDVSPGVSLQTKTGAIFDFGWSNSASIEDGGRTLASAAEVSIEQPLLRGAGVEVNMAPVAQARLGEKINRLRLKATVSETIGSVIFAHRELLLAQEELKSV